MSELDLKQKLKEIKTYPEFLRFQKFLGLKGTTLYSKKYMNYAGTDIFKQVKVYKINKKFILLAIGFDNFLAQQVANIEIMLLDNEPPEPQELFPLLIGIRSEASYYTKLKLTVEK